MKRLISLFIISACVCMCGHIEHDDLAFRNGAENVNNAIVTVTVTLPDGNTYTVDEYTTDVTVNTYQSENPKDWEIVEY